MRHLSALLVLLVAAIAGPGPLSAQEHHPARASLDAFAGLEQAQPAMIALQQPLARAAAPDDNDRSNGDPPPILAATAPTAGGVSARAEARDAPATGLVRRPHSLPSARAPPAM
ncbi:hypothetical protein [Sphingosinicella sp. LY1275]|uniref:hypothetical protein n=1 Tax=Sphingosinicella sp. LY1275 TaxID=3095379 RepID=UPI002ADEFB9C|nr:hypothetical protein [Sphingosinicella sp. LY1275]MEA1012961.1 hypothetical protein [Sphingosinicella sp. LY1275]